MAEAVDFGPQLLALGRSLELELLHLAVALLGSEFQVLQPQIFKRIQERGVVLLLGWQALVFRFSTARFSGLGHYLVWSLFLRGCR